MADTIIGIVGKDYVITAADASAGFSIIVMKQNEDKIKPLDNNKLLVANGENGDRVQFGEFIEKNLSLYRYINDRGLSTKSAAHFIRGELADALRQAPYYTNLLLAGVDEDGPSLYFIDYLASMQKVDYGVHGYGSYFCYSILDKNYRKDASLEYGKKLIGMCIREVQKRLLLNAPNFIIKVVDKNGIREIKLEDLEKEEKKDEEMKDLIH